MYKDPDKQREANRKAMQRLRAKNAGSALSGSKEVSQNARGLPVVDEVSDTLPVIPVIPKQCRDDDFAKLLVQTGADVCLKASKPKPQSHSPLMVGYVPPKN